MTISERANSDIFVGVGAVIFRGNDVLIIKRGKAPFKGLWSIPGGGLEFGETLIDAVKREVREETNIEIDIIGLIDVFEGFQSEREADGFRRHTLMIDYVADWKSGDVAAGDDAAEAEFVPIGEAKARMSWDLTRKAIARAEEIRANAAVR